MRVVHVSRFETGGGGALAANRLHGSLRRLGVDSTMYVAEKLTDDPTVTAFEPPRDLVYRVCHRLQHEGLRYRMRRYDDARRADLASFNDERVPGGRDVCAQLPGGDIVNIHVMYGFVDYRTFLTAVPPRRPVVRTLHEMSFFTGGCHYDVGCGKYRERCGACPRLGSPREQDLSRESWRRKKAILGSVAPGRLHLVAPSRWLANEARRSSLLSSFPVTVIPLAVDTGIFCPKDRQTAREALGIPPEAQVVLFVASVIPQPLKGFALLVEALNGLGNVPNLLLLSVGRGQLPLEIQIPHLSLGYIGSERLRALVYNAADVFVIPSVYDNLPQTVLEATACGTPVVGFAVGGIPDMVRPGVTGWVVPPQDVGALRDAIRALLREPARLAEMGANCRRIAIEEYALEVQARRYIQLYERILSADVSEVSL
jgi:glycosyltransferase involved in cell wall biosynthesis